MKFTFILISFEVQFYFLSFQVLAALIATCSAASINVGIVGYFGGAYVDGIGGTGYSGLAT